MLARSGLVLCTSTYCYRFGATDEIGVFEMTGGGLAEVADPSALFLAGRDGAAPGAAVFAGVEGARPVLVEIQALVAPSTLGTPRRAVVGWDSSRLAMMLAVLEAHGGLKLGQHDVYLNVAGGLRIAEPAADLAAAAALVSSLIGVSLPHDAVYFGEIALSGAVRAVGHSALRLKEAAKLGFTRAVAPPSRKDAEGARLKTVAVSSVASLVAEIAAAGVAAEDRPGKVTNVRRLGYKAERRSGGRPSRDPKSSRAGARLGPCLPILISA